MDTPTRTTNIPAVSALDEVLGNVTVDGIERTRRQTMGSLAAQLAGTEPIASMLADAAVDTSALESRVDGHDSQLAALGSRVDGVEDEIATVGAAVTTPGQVYLTKALRDADLAPAAGTLAQVTSDPDFQVNEYLSIKVGAAGVGPWSLTDIPSPSLNSRRLDNQEREPSFRNRTMGTDKYDVMVLRDASNRLIAGACQEDGEWQIGRWTHKPDLAHHDPYHPGGHPCLVTGGDLVVYHENGTATIDGNPYEFSVAGPGTVFASAVWNRPAMAAQTPVQIDRNLELFVPYGKMYMCFPGYGQSLKAGSHAVGPDMWINPSPETIKMPDTGYISDVRCGLHTSSGSAPVLAPGAITRLRAMESAVGEKNFATGQTSIETLCGALHTDVMRNLNFAPRLLGVTFAVGGFTLAQLTVGTQPYNNFLTGIEDLNAACDAEGYRMFVPCIPLRQGESDSANTGWEAGMITFQAAINTAIKGITGQAANVLIIMAAPSSFVKGNDKVIRAMINLHRNHPDKFILSHGSYHLDYDIYTLGDDYIHMSVKGQKIDGEYDYRTVRKAIFGRGAYNPLMPAGPGVMVGTTITVPMLVPKPPMVIDTTTISERSGTNKGFTFYDDSGSPPTVASVAVSGTNLVFELSGPSTGTPASRELRYAMEGHDGTAPFNASEMARGNIRDSEAEASIYYPGVINRNWMVPCPIEVTV